MRNSNGSLIKKSFRSEFNLEENNFSIIAKKGIFQRLTKENE